MSTTPEPPKGFRLLTDEEKKLPLPTGVMRFLIDDPDDAGWEESVCVGLPPADGFLYAVPITTPTAEGWMPIETAPKDGTSIMLGNPGWLIPTVGSWRHYGHAPAGWTGGGSNPTHWQPLPPPPQPEKQQ